jgi:integrase
MARVLSRLSALSVGRIKAPGRYADGGGLYFQVCSNGGRSWVFRFMLNGKRREIGLGSINDISLAEARKRAAECRRLKAEAVDPIEARRSERKAAELEAARALTFKECAEAYIEAHRPSWRNDKHAAQWPNSLGTYVYPTFGSQSVQDIDTTLVMKVLEPLWTSKPTTAARLRGRIENILDWAKARGLRAGENPARWRGHIENMLPRLSKIREVHHHKALPYQEIGGFMTKLRGQGTTSAWALELLILTATRTGEAINARWEEFDLEAGVWTIPASRMKAGREHRIPLSTAALSLVASLPRIKGCDFLFPGAKLTKPLCHIAMLELLRRMKCSHITAHGFRSTFRDWAAEQTNHQHEVTEMALAHTIRNKVEAAYRRGDLFEKRRPLMEDWAQYCASASTAEIVTLRRRA